MLFFFFQAEDGIRDGTVTGVQTCALPIWRPSPFTSASVTPVVKDGSWTTGATLADVNGNGRLDIYLCKAGKVPGALREIGRASCREMGEGSGSARSSQKAEVCRSFVVSGE